MKSLAKIESTETPHGISINQAYLAVTEGKLDGEKLKTLEKLLSMDAQRQFNQSFVFLQSQLPVITAKSVIPNRGKYEKFEDIMDAVQPVLTKHGFSVSFSQDAKDGRIISTCTLSHIAGDSRTSSFAVRPGGRSDSETQSDTKASTTAKRNALCAILCIVIRQDCMNNEDDAGIEGDPNAFVTPAQADELEHRVKMTNSDVAKFLAYPKAESFAKIPARFYDELDALLRRKEAGK